MDIVLSKFRPCDFSDYFRLVNDSQVMAMITERAIPDDEARRDYDTLLQANDLHPELGQFRIVDEHHGHFIGLAKLAVSDTDAQAAELGYMILPEYWGQGIASQVARMLMRLAREQPQLKSVFAIIDPANLPSRKILINNDFVSCEFKDFDGLPGEILECVWRC